MAYGDRDAVLRLLDLAKVRDAYLGIALVKLSGSAAHENFDRFIPRVVAQTGGSFIFLGCLDAPDVIVLSLFEGKGAMSQLIDWMKQVRGDKFLRGRIERKLTMIACADSDQFIARLSRLDRAGSSNAKALVRILDRRGGHGLDLLRDRLGTSHSARRLHNKLYASSGYYDVQGIADLREAAQVLKVALPLVRRGILSTSTCFVGQQSRVSDLGTKGKLGSPLKKPLEHEFVRWTKRQSRLKNIDCLHGAMSEALEDAWGKIRQLDGTGFLPGTRLLIWTCCDAVRYLVEESDDHFRARQGNADAVDFSFRNRQRRYAEFFRAIAIELDRRVSLSLPAYTRFFPSGIEAPLKVVGALDVASRLVATSFRAYHCRAKSRLLQVFVTQPGKPTYFVHTSRPGALRNARPFTTMSVTTLSPAMLRHFHLALFNVLHEVAYCVIGETLQHATFSALVYTHAMVERVANLSWQLALLSDKHLDGSGAPSPLSTAPTVKFLQDFFKTPVWMERTASVSVKYFIKDEGRGLPDRWYPKAVPKEWDTKKLFETQKDEWSVGHVTRRDGFEAAYLARRDALACDWLSLHQGKERFREQWIEALTKGGFSVSPQMTFSTFLRRSGLSFPVQRELDEEKARIAQIDLVLGQCLEACPTDEYLELASLIPFLRLFEEDAGSDPLLSVLSRLIRDYFAVWKDWANERMHLFAARRFVVAAAAVSVFHRQRQQQFPQVKANSPRADMEIQEAVKHAAQALLNSRVALDQKVPMELAFYKVWQDLESGEGRQLECAPLIVNGMVRYLVRMLHVFRLGGEHVRAGEKEHLRGINEALYRIFTREWREGDVMPVSAIAQLWAMQYRLTRNRDKASEFGTVQNAYEAIRVESRPRRAAAPTKLNASPQPSAAK